MSFRGLQEKDWEHYSNQFKTNTLILGDLNGHHPYWDTNNGTNTSGRTIFNFIQNNTEYLLLTPENLITRMNYATGKGSTIDLAIGHKIYEDLEIEQLNLVKGTADHVKVFDDWFPRFLLPAPRPPREGTFLEGGCPRLVGRSVGRNTRKTQCSP